MAFKPVFILSYPRSGMNWTRYIIQHIYPENQTKAGNLNFIHHHLVEELPDESLPLVLCLRDYREAIVRNTREYQCIPVIDNSSLSWDRLMEINEEKKTPTSEGRGEDLGGTIENYVRNLEVFDDWKGKKFMVKYEDMISNPIDVITELAWFLNRLPGEFLMELDYHTNNSINEYNTTHGSYTRGGKAKFHQRLMLEEDRIKLDEHIKHLNPYIFTKYLNQYRT